MEFLPADVGCSLDEETLKNVAARTWLELGWVQADDDFDRNLLKELVPYRVAIIKKGQVYVYIPSSGYLVACVPVVSTAGASDDVEVAHALRDRWKFHCSVRADEACTVLDEARELVAELRIRLRAVDKSAFRLSGSGCIFPYALSVFEVSGVCDSRSFQALLAPRELGCSTDAKEPPQLADLVQRIRGLKGEVIEPAWECNGQRLNSSWSTVVISGESNGSEGGVLLSTIVMLVEFRIQSTWCAAYLVRREASNIGKIQSFSAQGRRFSETAITFSQVAARHKNELGPNRPNDPSAVLTEITSTSGVNDEVEEAECAVEMAQKRISDATEQKAAKSRAILEVFGLLFASSSLAPVLWTPPLTLNTLEHELLPFSVWGILTIIGMLFIWRQRK